MLSYDIHIQGGTIVDGTRVPRFKGDVWLKDGRIAKVGGKADGVSERVIDAKGLIVAPGFIDLHTHYDAQIRWDPHRSTVPFKQRSRHRLTKSLTNCACAQTSKANDFANLQVKWCPGRDSNPHNLAIQGV